ncbi:transglycosylase family protein [Miltoncostaea oceani]|uniref:transglycosylase family protein n=1 Tax=Miltoncostaea oceani TaxID=2843216 RepID=UPI001C3DE2C1|nr:transglycosylase family protein [Miltoncostaea oceani]
MVLTVLGAAVLVGALAAIGGTAAPGTQVLDARRDQIRTLEAEVQRIDESARAAADAHAAAVRRADELQARIAGTNASLAEARRAHAVSVQRLSDRVVVLYRTGDPSLVEIVLSSGDLSDALDAQQALEQIGVNDRRIVEQLEGTRSRLRGLRAELESSRAGVEANVREKAARLADLEGLIADRRAALGEARTALDALIRQEERRQAVSAARERAAAAAAAAEESAERDLLRRAGAEPADPATPATPAAPAADPAPAPAAAPSGGVSEHLQRIAQCESGGNPTAVSSSGLYRGKYQFAVSTWQGLGGTGDPAAAPEAEQDRIAALLYARSGPAPWPVCGYR